MATLPTFLRCSTCGAAFLPGDPGCINGRHSLPFADWPPLPADLLPCLECEGLTGHALSCSIGRELDDCDACVTSTAPSLPASDAFHFDPTLSAIRTALALALAVLGGVPALCAILSVTAWAH